LQIKWDIDVLCLTQTCLQAYVKPKLALCAAKKIFEFLWIQLTIEPDILNFSTTQLQFLLCMSTTTWTTLKIRILQV